MSAQYPSSVFSSGYKKFDKKAKNPEEMKIRTHAAISVTVNHDWSLVREGCRKQRRERGKKSGREREMPPHLKTGFLANMALFLYLQSIYFPL